MARFYVDEGFPKTVAQLLRDLSHDVLTVKEAGQANQRIPDDQGHGWPAGFMRRCRSKNDWLAS